MEENIFARFAAPPSPRERAAELDVGFKSNQLVAQKLAEDAAKRAALKDTRHIMTDAELKAARLPPGSYSMDGLGNISLNPGKQPRPVDRNRVASLRDALQQLHAAQSLANNSNFTVGGLGAMMDHLPPFLSQNRVDFKASNDAVNAKLMQDVVAKAQENAPAGVTSMFNQLQEQQRAAAAIGNMDLNQSRESYNAQVARVERYFNDQIKAAGGTPDAAPPPLSSFRRGVGPNSTPASQTPPTLNTPLQVTVRPPASRPPLSSFLGE